MKIFVDMDGVLADFDLQHERWFGWSDATGKPREPEWEKITPEFWSTMPPTPDADELMQRIHFLMADVAWPVILTKLPKMNSADAALAKLAWVRRHYTLTDVITVHSEGKAAYCTPGDVLIDDSLRWARPWESAGGFFILHAGARQSLAMLREHLNQ